MRSTIAVFGAGNVGTALGRLWIAKGREIVFGVPQPDSGKYKIPDKARITTTQDAANSADIVALCVPWSGVQKALQSVESWAGKILIDCTNPLLPDLSGLDVKQNQSGAETVLKWASGAKVVKAFNTIGAANYGNAQFGGEQADGFYCGDDEEAKTVVQPLIQDAGLHPADVGPLRNARSLEAIAMLWIDLAVNQKQGINHGFKLLRR